ncbi:MAG: hypothetical protein ACYTAF_03240 [Planctomycetota bacterium]|jgi:hypothetical protein
MLKLGLALALLAFPCQEPPDDDIAALKKQIGELTEQVKKLGDEMARLKAENESLKKKLEEQEKLFFDLAKRLHEKRSTARADATPPAPKKDTTPPSPTEGRRVPGVDFPAPDHEIRGEVRATRKDLGWIVINLGKRDGIEIGYHFEILQEAHGESKCVAVAVAEKYMGQNEMMTRLKVKEGNIDEVQVDDVAIAIRKEVPVPVPNGGARPDPARKGYTITGKAGASYVINYGSLNGAQLTDKVYVYRDSKFIATLRIDDVKKDWCIANVIEQNALPQADDFISTQEPLRSVFGQIKINDETRGIIVSVGSKDGAKPGMIFEVRRKGRPIGRIELTTVQEQFSYAKAHGESKRTDFHVDDFAEALKE